MIKGVGTAWSWPCSYPTHTKDRMVTKSGEVLRCVEGYMCMLDFSDLEFFACLSYIRSCKKSILKELGLCCWSLRSSVPACLAVLRSEIESFTL